MTRVGIGEPYFNAKQVSMVISVAHRCPTVKRRPTRALLKQLNVALKGYSSLMKEYMATSKKVSDK